MPKNPLSDPAQMDQMMDMAKKSMVSMVPQTVIMGWINYFFTGFVLSAYAIRKTILQGLNADPRESSSSLFYFSQITFPAHFTIQAHASTWYRYF